MYKSNFISYPRPAVGEESFVVGPVFRINVKQSGSHDEYPHSQVDNIQDVIENKGLLHASRHDHHHDQRDEKGEEIRRTT